MRRKFAAELFKQMEVNENIHVLVGDVGYGMFDKIKETFPDRFVNTGASEQALIGIAVGLAMEGKIPFVYTITPFLLCRPFETIRNYINNESIPVKLIGSGRGRDYAHDGFSHWAQDDDMITDMFHNIICNWPQRKAEIPDLLDIMIKSKQPYYLNLTR